MEAGTALYWTESSVPRWAMDYSGGWDKDKERRMLKADSLTGIDDLYQKLADATITSDGARDELIRTERRVRTVVSAAVAFTGNAVEDQALLDGAVNAHVDYQNAWATARDAADAATRARAALEAALARIRLREVEAVEKHTDLFGGRN